MIALWLAACGVWEATEPPPAPGVSGPDVVLVTLDTTRADRLGSYGYDQAHTEHLDALAARGRRYDRAYSTLPLTIPAHASIFTGKYPPELGIRSNGKGVLQDGEQTLAEVFQEAGYATGAAVAAFVTTDVWGFDQGFESFRDEIPISRQFWRSERSGEEVVDDILAWRAAQTDGRPLFAWVHLYDPHFPYNPPKAYFEEAEHRPYDAELAYVDDQIGRLVEGFGEDSLFVVVADHGESLGDHGEFSHGLFVYPATQRVPYIMAGPGIAPEVVDEPVSLVDVAPTLLAELGLPPLSDATGRVAPGEPPTPIYMESYQLMERFGIAPHVSVIQGDLQLIGLPRPEILVGGEPAERPEELAPLSALLEGFEFGPPGDGAAISPSLAMQLEALGYAEGGFAGDLDGELPDPKDRPEIIEKIQLSERLSLEERHEELLDLVASLSETYPDILEFQHRRVTLLAGQGRHGEALEAVEGLRARDPDNPMIQHTRATLLSRTGRHEEAAIAYQEVARAMPYAPQIRAQAVGALVEISRTKGIELGLSYLEDYPDDYAVAGLVGLALLEERQLSLGLTYLERGDLADVPQRDVAYRLAAAAAGRGDRAEARRLLERELTHHPIHPEALVTLLRLMGADGGWGAQLARVEPFLEGPGKGMKPEILVPFWHIKAQALYNLQRYEEAREALKTGLSLDDGHPDLLMLDANLLNQAGRREEAVGRAEEARAAKALREAADQGK